MSKFINGPFAGRSLMLRRAPAFLRVVRSPDNTMDALDQVNDRPEPAEKIFVYRLTKKPTMMHLNCRGSRRAAGGMYMMGEYEIVHPQPDDATVRDAQLWASWCTAQGPDQLRLFK